MIQQIQCVLNSNGTKYCSSGPVIKTVKVARQDHVDYIRLLLSHFPICFKLAGYITNQNRYPIEIANWGFQIITEHLNVALYREFY